VNRKLGGSIKTGLAAATGDVVLYTDADLPFDMAELRRAFRILRNYEADILSAYRLDRTGEGLRRAVYSFVYNADHQRLRRAPA
jgi:glycosyltransferase involved in cell wall biosynthesis